MRLIGLIGFVLAGCGGGSGDGAGQPAEDSGMADSATSLTTPLTGRCSYANPFSGRGECKEYVGEEWTTEAAQADCAAPVPGGEAGVFDTSAACARDAVLGECVVDEDGPLHTRTVFDGTDPSWCGGAELGCGFLQGEFLPAEPCLAPDDAGVSSADAFVPFAQVCVEPLVGEAPGIGPDGLVCTWEAISASTEAGRRFVDYAECDPVLKQRPYYPYPPATTVQGDSSRVNDPAWAEEYEWVSAQLEASACVCCHSQAEAPEGPSGWYMEDGPIWIDGIGDDGLAMLAGWVDSTVFGAFDPQDNNGFDRQQTGLPTTDPVRMARFLEGELALRGRTRADFATTPPFGGILYDQIVYEPGPCGVDQGMDAAGVLQWTGGPARYVYVLELGSLSPGVPPNLDRPQGTLWRLDVAPEDPPLVSGLSYGASVAGATVAWPPEGEAPQLISGESYYLVALRDVYQPATRCVFVAP